MERRPYEQKLDKKVREEIRLTIIKYRNEGWTNLEIAELINADDALNKNIGRQVNGNFVSNQYCAAIKKKKKKTTKKKPFTIANTRVILDAVKKAYPNSISLPFILTKMPNRDQAKTVLDDLHSNGLVDLFQERGSHRVKATEELINPTPKETKKIEPEKKTNFASTSEDIQILREVIVGADKVDSKVRLRLLDLVTTLEKV